MSNTRGEEQSGPPTWPDGTVRLPDAIESWLDGHFAGEKDDDPDDLERARNATAVALWSLIWRQGDVLTDQLALDAFCDVAFRESLGYRRYVADSPDRED